MDPIIERIEREAGVPGLAGILADRLTPTDLQSLLLEVHRRRSARRPAHQVLAGYQRDRLVQPAAVSPLRLSAWEACAYSHLPAEFDALALSPVCPAGTCSAVAAVHPDWALTTIRNSEVVADSTNVLALECAVRRRQILRDDPQSKRPVHLAASHRLLRAQHYDSPKAAAHFSAFALTSAGRDAAGGPFERSAIELHARFYLQALRAFLGVGPELVFSVSDFGPRTESRRAVAVLLEAIETDLPAVACRFDEGRSTGRGYYPRLCFHIHVRQDSGELLELVDGGAVDWAGRLLGNAKERLVISGIGCDQLCSRF